MNANYLFDSLKKDNVIGSEGITIFRLSGIDVNIKDVSIVGNVLQEWLMHYMKKNGIYFRIKDNTQEFPDYLLSESSKQDLLEVKAFTKSPNFDIANFAAYARSLREDAYRLDAKYLILKYSKPSTETQSIVIDNIWLKNVWEIAGASERSPIKIQWKQGTPVNIRPCVWYGKPTYPPFTSRLEFVEALSKVVGMAQLDTSIAKNWLNVVKDNYYQHTGEIL